MGAFSLILRALSRIDIRIKGHIEYQSALGRNDASCVFKLYIISLYLPTLLSNGDIMYAVCEEDRIKMEKRLQKRAYNNILWRLSSLLSGRLLGKRWTALH